MIGLEKYLIPVKKSELTIEKVFPYFDTIINTFNQNATKWRANYDKYKGQHDIYGKQRRYDDESEINNMVAEPHLWNMVNFKCGYTCGQPIEYDPRKEMSTNELDYLNRHFNYVNKQGVDTDVTQGTYAGGNGYYFIEPQSFTDLNYQAPFKLLSLPSDKCGKVYSSYLGNEPLFDFIITYATRIDENNRKTNFTQFAVYLPDNYYLFERPTTTPPNTSGFQLIETERRLVYKYLPLVEKFSNIDRVGIVEISNTLQNALDKISSNSLDNIEDLTNELLVIRNCVLGETDDQKRATLKSARKNGAIEINDPSPDKEADIKTITQKLNHSDINILVENIKNTMYGTNGVPIYSSNTTSGGDTQGARELGNGWQNAYIIIKKETNVLIIADREVLERVLFIEKSVANSVIKTLTVGDIDIKYPINRSDNLLSKTQSYTYLVDRNVPPEIALNICELSSDPHTVGTMIEENIKRQKEEEQAKADMQFERQQQIAQQNAKKNEQNANGINENKNS